MQKIKLAIIVFAAGFASTALGSDINPNLKINFDEKLEKEFVKNYGVREKDIVKEIFHAAAKRQFMNDDLVVEIAIKNIVPNRPTFEQLSSKPGLSMQSFSIGGANIDGKVYDKSGNLLATAHYDYLSPNIWEAQHRWTWQDAEYAANRLMKKLSLATK